METSLVGRILKFNKPFILYHTYIVTNESLNKAISENKSVDLDISVDNSGMPYLGHSLEYYKKSGEERANNMPFWEAIDLVTKSSIPVIVDCKDYNAWGLTQEVVAKTGPHRCLVHIYAAELKFDYNIYDNDYLSEWLGIEKLKQLKQKFPNVTTTASAKYLPRDLLSSNEHKGLLHKIRKSLKDNNVDTVCLNVLDETFSDGALEFFLKENIVPHVGVDNIDISKLTKIFIGETDILSSASDSRILGY